MWIVLRVQCRQGCNVNHRARVCPVCSDLGVEDTEGLWSVGRGAQSELQLGIRDSAAFGSRLGSQQGCRFENTSSKQKHFTSAGSATMSISDAKHQSYIFTMTTWSLWRSQICSRVNCTSSALVNDRNAVSAAACYTCSTSDGHA